MEQNEDFTNYSKEELVAKVKALQAHNVQLKNIIQKTNREGTQTTKQLKAFDFSKCKFRRVMLKFFYLGWDYQGYVVQEDTTNTIEHHLFKALQKTCLIKDRASSNYHRCGRTDRGVSSFGQTISIDLRTNNESNENEIGYCKLLNRVLPNDIKCVAWCPIGNELSARFDCKSRTYKYFFPLGNLNIEKMRTASAYLIGTHDFRNFCKMDVANGVVKFVRNVIEIRIYPFDDNQTDGFAIYVFEIKGNAFLWHQIRCIVAILLLVGQGREEPDLVKKLLDIENNPQKPDYNMASEIPLNLYFCDYNLDNWFYDKDTIGECVKKLANFWTFLTIKSTMIKSMIKDLEDKTDDFGCFSDNLIQGVKPKNYVPVMKRKLCESLENRIKHHSKKLKN